MDSRAFRRSTRIITCAAALWTLAPSSSRAAEGNQRAVEPRAGGNLLGHRGLLRVTDAATQPVGTISIGTNLQFYSAGDFLPGSVSGKADHSRMVNTFGLGWTPLRYLETAFAVHVISDDTTGGGPDELQVTVGNPELSIKGSYPLLPSLDIGALVAGRFLSGSGFFESGGATYQFEFAALGSWKVFPTLPLNVHLNIGFVVDGSEHMFDDPSLLTPAQLYSAQLSSFNRLELRLGVQYVTKYVGPFLEASLEPFVGSDAPGFADSPSRLSLGLQGWLGPRKDLQLLAAVDIGLAGISDGLAPNLPAGKYAFPIPAWNIAFRLSYRFDPFASTPSRTTAKSPATQPAAVPAPIRTAAVTGSVADEKTRKPIWNARIRIDGSEVSSLAVDPQDGSFRSFELPVGRYTLVVSADGYKEARIPIEVTEQGAQTTALLTPEISERPGSIRGTITAAQGGQRIRKATVLIPEIDRAITVDTDATFNVSLKPGQYEVLVSAPGYRTQRKTIRVLEATTVILNVELHK